MSVLSPMWLGVIVVILINVAVGVALYIRHNNRKWAAITAPWRGNAYLVIKDDWWMIIDWREGFPVTHSIWAFDRDTHFVSVGTQQDAVSEVVAASWLRPKEGKHILDLTIDDSFLDAMLGYNLALTRARALEKCLRKLDVVNRHSPDTRLYEYDKPKVGFCLETNDYPGSPLSQIMASIDAPAHALATYFPPQFREQIVSNVTSTIAQYR